MKANVFSKPSNKQKGSQTMAVKGDHKSQLPTKKFVNGASDRLGSQNFGNPQNGNVGKTSFISTQRTKAMIKVMKKYPNGYGAPNPTKVVGGNEQAKDMGPAISQKGSKRNLKFVAH